MHEALLLQSRLEARGLRNMRWSVVRTMAQFMHEMVFIEERSMPKHKETDLIKGLFERSTTEFHFEIILYTFKLVYFVSQRSAICFLKVRFQFDVAKFWEFDMSWHLFVINLWHSVILKGFAHCPIPTFLNRLFALPPGKGTICLTTNNLLNPQTFLTLAHDIHCLFSPLNPRVHTRIPSLFAQYWSSKFACMPRTTD